MFSHDIFANQRFGGITRYFAELHRALRRQGVESTVLAPLHQCELLGNGSGILGFRVPNRLSLRGTRRLAAAVGRIAEPIALVLARRLGDIVLHRTYYSARPVARGVATAVTVYDLIAERRAMACGSDALRSRGRSWCEQADVVLAISHYTKAEVVEVFDIPPQRIVVTHLGVTRAEPAPDEMYALHQRPPFLLYVGNRKGYKNFELLIDAFARSDTARDGVQLVAFGGGAPTAREHELLRASRVGHLVTFADGDDASLAAHYATAKGMVYPSLDEGFGLPPLEAMAHGCPVAASRAGAIPEVVGDAALLFQPTEVEAARAALDRIVYDSAVRADLALRGSIRAAMFTWEAVARRTLSAYASALQFAESQAP
jgi:glycosyltransferase involved in cell wall biosynthesis